MSDYTGGEDGYSPLMGASRNFVDVNTLARHENPNYEGTPTQFFDDQGNLKAILADLVGSGQHPVDPYSYNPVLKEGEKLSADTARQATNEENQLLFLDNEGNQTTRNTGKPLVGGTLHDVMYERDPGSRGGFLPKDTYQGLALLATAASLGTLGPAFLAGEGFTGLGAVGGAEAFPVLGGAAIPGTELGAVGTGALGAGGAGAVGAGSLTAGLTPEMIAASEAALPQTMADIGGLSSTAAGGAGAAGAGGLTDAQATALMENNLLPADMQIPASQGLTATEAMRYANLAKSALSSLGGGTGGAGAGAGAGGAGGSPFAIPAATAGAAGASGLSQMSSLNPQYLTTGSAPTTTPSGLIDYKPLSYIDPSRYANVSDVKPLSRFDKNPFESGLQAAHGGHIKESMGRHPELQDIDPRLLSMIMQSMAFQDGGKSHVPEFITGATGHYVKGKGDGQSDDIPAMLADGEFVWDAETVAQLGNGSSDAGAKFLDKFREAVRSHKRSAPNDKIPPKASPLQYVKEAMKNTEKE